MYIALFAVTIICTVLVWKSKWFSRLGGFDNVVVGFVAPITLLLSPVYYEFPGQGTSVVTFEDGKFVQYPVGLFAWEWSDHYSNLLDPTNEVGVTSSVTPITDNPKARKIRYETKSVIFDPSRYFKASGQRIGMSSSEIRRDVGDLVAYQLYEFNDRYSKRLANFYNPLDEAQQHWFEELIRERVNMSLQWDGVKIVKAEFFISRN